MRLCLKTSFLLTNLILMVGIANAAEIPWEGTLRIDLVSVPPLILEGSGVATVTAGGVDTQLRSIRLRGGITGSAYAPLTDPAATANYDGIALSATLGTGTLTGFDEPPSGPGLIGNKLPVKGFARMCIVMMSFNCSSAFPFPLTTPRMENGVGIGGLVTAGGYGETRISIEAAPWTFHGETIINTTQGGGILWKKEGFLHGPSSYTFTALQEEGVLQLVTPLHITGSGVPDLPGFTTLTIRFVPEPGFLLLIGSGIVGLVALRRAARRSQVE